MTSFDKLVALFREFPGIGPRQAKRFVFFLLSRDKEYITSLKNLIEELPKDVARCASCFRFFQKRAGALCTLCSDKNRSESELMVVATDTDLDTIEKSGGFKGRYFVLGGNIPLLPKKKAPPIIRLKELLTRVEKDSAAELKEIILALSANPDGEHTSDELRKALSPLASTHGFRISTLGRGLSTGSELEYADSETIKQALTHRG
ncbi:MAG: toprim domain-containing protein [bacterium]|nr:toprim domain-containing protein [bacterium]